MDWKEIVLDRWSPCLVEGSAGEVRLGHPLVDDYLELVRARARRNTLLAAAYDLKVFFGVVDKDPLEVKTADVYAFVKAQRQGPPASKVVRLADGSAGLELSTIQRRLSTLSGFYAYLVATERLERSRSCVVRRRGLREIGVVVRLRSCDRCVSCRGSSSLLKLWRCCRRCVSGGTGR